MNDTEPGIRWYACLTGPREEFYANGNLKRLGYWTWLPYHKVKKFRKRPNRNQYDPVWTMQAFFSRYLFIALRGRTGENFHDINECEGVSCVVSCNGVPLEIPVPIMDELMSVSDTNGLLGEKNLTERQRFQPGEQVEFVDESPFAGFLATIKIDRGPKVRIWCEQLQADMTVPPEIIALRA